MDGLVEVWECGFGMRLLGYRLRRGFGLRGPGCLEPLQVALGVGEGSFETALIHPDTV